MRKAIIIFTVALLASVAPAFGQQRDSLSVLSYEDIMGKNKIELENEFISTIRKGIHSCYPFNPADYERAGGLFYIKNGSEYYAEHIRNDSYAIKKGKEIVPLLDASYPQESVMTLFTTPAAARNFDIELHHHKYGFAEDIVTINLSDLLASCIEAGCIPFVGIEKCEKDAITASVFLVNEACGYNHIMKVTLRPSLLRTASGCISADLYTYIPTHNISDLFAR